MNGKGVVVLVSAAVLGLAACGGSSSPSSDARAALLRAVSSTVGLPYRADMTFGASLQGQPGSQFGAPGSESFAAQMHMDVQSTQRLSGSMSTSAASYSLKQLLTLFDGTMYVSSDGGQSYKTLPLNTAAFSQFGSQSALQYLQATGTVTDEGPGTADGVSVERYHASLDPSKIQDLLKTVLSSLPGASVQQLLSTVQLSNGVVDAAIDHQNHLVTETGSMDFTMDLGALQPSQQSSPVSAHETMNAHFYDYGANIIVTKPANVTGALSIPGS